MREGKKSIGTSLTIGDLHIAVGDFLTLIDRVDLINLSYDEAATELKESYANVLWKAAEKLTDLSSDKKNEHIEIDEDYLIDEEVYKLQ